MTPPVLSVGNWLPAAFDPILIALAVVLGWKADQFGKIVVAVIAALGASVLASWAITALGLPWIAPVGGEHPSLLPVRAVAAFIWATGSYLSHKLLGR